MTFTRRATYFGRPSRKWQVCLQVVICGVIAMIALLTPATTAQAAKLVQVSGAGSTWSQNALSQWISNVRNNYGIVINYQGSGSSDGRNQFKNGTVDFGVSEIPYGITDNGVGDPPPTRKYSYMPIVAGGTSFMYNLKINGVKVTQLRLSGQNIVKIFTGVITNWSDPAIKADNPGLTLPARKIVPVVRSDGSGTTAQFTTWMSKKYPDLWNAYCARAGRSSNPCGVTSNYPPVSGVVVGQAGSVGVAGYVKQSTNEGTITYVEYSYALEASFPVVKLLNAAGYYVEPTAQNVAVGLLGATINKDTASSLYLTQQLDGVYGNTDARAYPLSSYSYMIIPTGKGGVPESPMNTDKGYTLGKFAYYFLCQGQQQASVLGYSPLPINLVQAGFDEVKKMPGVEVQSISIQSCNNPTFSSDGTNTLAKTAPQPAACAKQGPAQCGTAATGTSTTSTSTSTTTRASTSTTGATNSTGATGTTAASGSTGASGTTGAAGSSGASGSTGAAGANGTATNRASVRATSTAGARNSAGANGAAGNQQQGAAGANGSTAGGGTPIVDPETGQTIGVAGAGNGSGNGNDNGAAQQGDGSQVVAGAPVQGSPFSLSGSYTNSGGRTALMLLAVALLIGVTVGPPLAARYGSRGRAR